MHIITCPKCKTKLRLEKPLAKAKVRCRQCGTVFIGTSEPMAEQPEAKTAAAVANIASHARTDPKGHPVHDVHRGRRPIPAAKVQGAPWMAAVVVIAVIGIGGAIYVGYYLRTHPYVEITDENDNITYSGRMHIDEYERRIAAIEEKKKLLEAAKAEKNPKPPTNNTSTAGHEDGGTVIETTPLPDSTTTITSTVTYDEDLNIPVLLDPTPLTAVPGRLDFIGEVRNKYDYPLESAIIHVSIRDEEDNPIAVEEIAVKYIPAKGMVPFSVCFKNIKASQVVSAKGYATGNKVGAGVVCWELPPGDCKKDLDKTDNRTFVLTGPIANNNDFDVADVTVYVDFYDNNGRHLGVGTGKLDKTSMDNIPSGKKAHFRVDFETFDPTLVEKWTVRVVGQMS